MDLLKIAKKNDDMEYRSWEAFMADIKWIVHNAKAYFDTSKLNNAYQSHGTRSAEPIAVTVGKTLAIFGAIWIWSPWVSLFLLHCEQKRSMVCIDHSMVAISKQRQK